MIVSWDSAALELVVDVDSPPGVESVDFAEDTVVSLLAGSSVPAAAVVELGAKVVAALTITASSSTPAVHRSNIFLCLNTSNFKSWNVLGPAGTRNFRQTLVG